MEIQTYKIIVFSLWIILPILPAFILYKFLPKNKVVVKGPFKGLTVDMAGAFAGYFLLFLASYLIIKKMMFELPDRSEVWSVIVNVYDENGMPIDKNKNKPDVTFYPQAEIENGKLDFDLPVKVQQGYYNFPGISLSAYSDTSKLFIPSDSNSDLFDPDIERLGGASKQKNGNWEYDFIRKILTYSAKIKLIKEVPASKEGSSFFKMDSMAQPQHFLNGND